MVAGGGGPAMARGIGCKAALALHHLREALQLAVIGVECRLILLIGCTGVQRADNRKDIGRAGGAISVHDALDSGLYADSEQLSRLSAGIADNAAAQVAAPQVGDIHECHTAGAVAKDEYIASKGEGRVLSQGQVIQCGDSCLLNSPFAGAVNARIDLCEGVSLRGEVFPHCPIIDCPQHPHIERDGVAHKSALDEVGVIPADDLLGKLCHSERFAIQKAAKALQGFGVVLRRTNTI